MATRKKQTKARAFFSPDDLLDTARAMLIARKLAAESPRDRKLQTWSRRVTREWHRSFDATGDRIDLCARCRRLRLNRMEREILVSLLLYKLALLMGEGGDECREVMEVLRVPGSKRVAAMRCMGEDGRLFRARLIAYEDEDDEPGQRTLVLDPALIDGVLEKTGARQGLPVRSEAALHGRLTQLTVTLRKKAEQLHWLMAGYGSVPAFFRLCRRAERMFAQVEETLDIHRGWALSRLFRKREFVRSERHRLILLVLLGKELGHLSVDEPLFQGGGLARAVSVGQEQVKEMLELLRKRSVLTAKGYVQPAGGDDQQMTDDPDSIEKAEFELTPKCLKLLGLDKKHGRGRAASLGIRAPQVRLSNLALAESTKKALGMAAAQARHAGVLMGEWGLSEILPYGRAVTLLFSGPPGVGKTACAEGMAHELGKSILVADYSRIQNCWVGQTEKNIVKTFGAARKAGALLFWDEADAMFYDRDAASRSWEVRDVNVLLQEIERFEGVCVLATNRKVSLDPALERRITLKVGFEKPDRALRRKIWAKLLPRKLPVGRDVDLDKLAKAELTGGQIKNVVLNAARLALLRKTRGSLTMKDFEEAVKMETGKWGKNKTIGFGK